MDYEGDETSKRSKPIKHSSCPTLPPELIICILARVPVKSLLQFRSVSKSWLSLISSPEFVKTQLSLSVNNNEYAHHRLLLSSYSRPPKFKNGSLSSLLYGSVTEAFDPCVDSTFQKHAFFRILGNPVNGLICLSASVGRDLFLWNPSIRKSKKLPHSLAMPRRGYWRYSNNSFGYDELHDVYKVVGFYSDYVDGHSGDVKVEIYNSKSDSWRTFDDFQCRVFHFHWDSAKFVNGKLHWVATCSFRGYNSGDIFSIDLTDEKWGKVDQPCYGEGDFSFKLEVLGSNLSMLCTSERTCADVWGADVWVMKEYGVKESWTKMYTINIPNQHESLVLFMSYKGEILFVFQSKVIIYNPNDGSIRQLELGNLASIQSAGIYIESLVSPTSDK